MSEANANAAIMAACDPRNLDTAELTRRLRDLAAGKRNVDVDFLLHLDAFDARNAYLDAGFCSLWDFCLRELHLREATPSEENDGPCNSSGEMERGRGP